MCHSSALLAHKVGEKKTILEQMTFSFCFLKNPLPCISVLTLLLIFACFLDHLFLSILLFTSTVLILSPFSFTFLNQKPILEKKSIKYEILIRPEQENSTHIEGEEEVISKTLVPENESTTQDEKSQVEEEEGGSGQTGDYSVKSSPPVILSESDCLGPLSTSEGSEVDWSQDNMFRSSDGSISDDDSLIELALPSGHYVGHKEEEEHKFNRHKKLASDHFAAGSFFKQHGPMELLAELNEMNEKENLIEIDISMGSVKCPRFEIEA